MYVKGDMSNMRDMIHFMLYYTLLWKFGSQLCFKTAIHISSYCYDHYVHYYHQTDDLIKYTSRMGVRAGDCLCGLCVYSLRACAKAQQTQTERKQVQFIDAWGHFWKDNIYLWMGLYLFNIWTIMECQTDLVNMVMIRIIWLVCVLRWVHGDR